MEECMESELSGIFRVKLVAKNIVLGSPGTHFMHMMRVKKKIGSRSDHWLTPVEIFDHLEYWPTEDNSCFLSL